MINSVVMLTRLPRPFGKNDSYPLTKQLLHIFIVS